MSSAGWSEGEAVANGAANGSGQVDRKICGDDVDGICDVKGCLFYKYGAVT